MKQITHLVFAGNALKSICICGVLRYIYCYKMDKNIRDVAGTSMGAFFSLAYALKIPIERLEKIIYATMKSNITKIYPTNFINLINNYGFNNPIDYLIGLREYIKEVYNQDDITFLELTKKTGINLYVSVSEINTGINVIFNVNDYPNVSVLEAISASMSIPVLSKPVKIDGKYYVDGYLTNNFPIEVFSHINSEFILGIGVNTLLECSMNNDEKELSFIKYYSNIFLMIYNNTDALCYYNKIKNHKNILFITNSPVKSILNANITDEFIDFELDEELINNLFLQGFKEMNDYSNNSLDLAFEERSSNFQDI